LELKLLGQRWYDSGVGRFISRDPIGEEGGLNLYGYVGNNCVNEIDALGNLRLIPIPFPIPFGWGPTIGTLRCNVIDLPSECEGSEVPLFQHCYVACISAKFFDPTGIVASEVPAFIIKIFPKKWEERLSKTLGTAHWKEVKINWRSWLMGLKHYFTNCSELCRKKYCGCEEGGNG